MIDKKEFLLQSIIKAYIEHLEPIGSSQLKSMYDITYSPATIRGYFKKLGDEGFLAQEHVSSGRTPTSEALKQYWSTKLDFQLEFVDEKAIEYYCLDIGVTAFVLEETNDVLKDILNVENKYMILEFSTFMVTVRFSDALHRFLKDMIGLELSHIVSISKQVGAIDIYESINQFLKNRDFTIYNTKDFFSLALNYNYDEKMIDKFLNGTIFEEIQNGLYFDSIVPQGYMASCYPCVIKGKESRLLVVGELSKDYEYFYNKISMK